MKPGPSPEGALPELCCWCEGGGGGSNAWVLNVHMVQGSASLRPKVPPAQLCSISPRSHLPVAAWSCSITFCFQGVCTVFAALSQGLLPSQGGTNCISALSFVEVMQWCCSDLMRTEAKSSRTSSLLVQHAPSLPPRKALLSFNLQCSVEEFCWWHWDDPLGNC